MISKTNNQPTKPLILLVDDTPLNIRILGRILKNDDYEIAVAVNGKETFDFIENKIPDLILLDVMLPDINGFDICAKLKSEDRTKEIPIMFLTAKVEVEDKVKGFKLGAVDYITKPIEEEEVLVRVRTQIDVKKSKDEIKNAYDKLVKTQSELIKLEKKNSAMAIAVTANHELNQPLMVLQGYLEIFLMTIDVANLSDQQKKCLNEINKSVNKMSDILEKFKNVNNLSFKDYEKETEMVIFDDTSN